MTTIRRLAATLARTLEAKAEQAMPSSTTSPAATDPGAAAVAAVPSGPVGAADPEATDTGARGGAADVERAVGVPRFDPARPSRLPGATPREAQQVGETAIDLARRQRRGGDRPPHRRRRLLLRAAAALLVVLLAAGALTLHAGGPGQGRRDGTDTVTVGPPPDGWLVPTWLPEGMQLWGVEWSTAPSGPPRSGPARRAERGTIPQLFGEPGSGTALYVTASRYEVAPGTAEPVTVRGHAGRAGETWDVEEADVGQGIAWEERGVALTALYRGMSRLEAIAALDALRWRSDDVADGFAPPGGDGRLPLRAEAEGATAPSGARYVTLALSEGPPSGDPGPGRPGLEVHTSAGGGVSADYLEEWYLQGRSAGGGQRPLRRYDHEWRDLTVTWPDGRAVTISPTGPRSGRPDREMLERLARSLTVASEADLAALRDTAEAHVAALPTLLSAETRIGTVEAHGQDGFLQLCLRRGAGEPPSCQAGVAGSGSFDERSGLATADWIVDGRWYVVVVSRGEEPPQVLGSRDPAAAPDAGELPTETITAGDWTTRLVEPLPDIQAVCLGMEDTSVICLHWRHR